jgi:hydroxypyruvate isomerase
MPKFSANLTMMFNEVDFLARFERASTAGFKAVEYDGWIGCEYIPAGTTEEGLGWIAPYK